MEVKAVEAGSFERRYRADPDPWRYDSSASERSKYEHTLAAVPAGAIGEALELGCSNGAFTTLLADRCKRLLAVDFSREAVHLAKRRTSALAGVVVEEHDLRRGLPGGPFDLILCSEVLYYCEPEDVLGFCDSAVGALRPGGSLLAVHWRGHDPAAPLDGDEVHRLLAAELSGRLEHVRSEARPGYLLDRWERPPTP